MIIVKKHADRTFECWAVDIPENDPTWKAFCEQHETEGYSECGITLPEMLEAVKESFE